MARAGSKRLPGKNTKVIASKPLCEYTFELMEKNRKKPISILPVTNEFNKIIGILKLHDLLQEGIK